MIIETEWKVIAEKIGSGMCLVRREVAQPDEPEEGWYDALCGNDEQVREAIDEQTRELLMNIDQLTRQLRELLNARKAL